MRLVRSHDWSIDSIPHNLSFHLRLFESVASFVTAGNLSILLLYGTAPHDLVKSVMFVLEWLQYGRSEEYLGIASRCMELAKDILRLLEDAALPEEFDLFKVSTPVLVSRC
jgi:hypothetical protein